MINSLYIHIPFCIRKCIYCDFLSVPYDEALALRYAAAAAHELDLRREAIDEITTVYIGGGTPTTMPTLSLIGLLRKIRDSFTLAADAEITIEVNPGTIDKEKACALSDAGVNRFSIGVQSFLDRELQFLGRIHSFEDAIKSISAVRNAGAKNLSLDLIYGIPGQTLDDWSHSLATAREFFPEHISTYELTPEVCTPLYELIREKRVEKPDEETIIGMYYHAIDGLTGAGYGHYEISNFARPGFACRHNLNYWDRGEYIGIGAGAHSFIAGRRTRNTNDIGKYLEALRKGELSTEEDIGISRVEEIREVILLGLRKTEGLNVGELREVYGIDIAGTAAALIKAGLLSSDKDCLCLTRRGLVISNTVITELFAALEKGNALSR
ncbi:MAG: radical SAM family heme chaperone HemW [Nitrospirae bacterium]|nr:radical SAM family heme chaperone HemW [Nitrospirota bacterium]